MSYLFGDDTDLDGVSADEVLLFIPDASFVLDNLDEDFDDLTSDDKHDVLLDVLAWNCLEDTTYEDAQKWLVQQINDSYKENGLPIPFPKPAKDDD